MPRLRRTEDRYRQTTATAKTPPSGRIWGVIREMGSLVAEGIHILTPDNVSPTGEYEEKWCFRCRKRTRHERRLVTQEWYEPTEIWVCPLCNEDNTEFPE